MASDLFTAHVPRIFARADKAAILHETDFGPNFFATAGSLGAAEAIGINNQTAVFTCAFGHRVRRLVIWSSTSGRRRFWPVPRPKSIPMFRPVPLHRFPPLSLSRVSETGQHLKKARWLGPTASPQQADARSLLIERRQWGKGGHCRRRRGRSAKGRFETPPSVGACHLACTKSHPLISAFPSSVNWRRRIFRSAMLSKRVRWRVVGFQAAYGGQPFPASKPATGSAVDTSLPSIRNTRPCELDRRTCSASWWSSD